MTALGFRIAVQRPSSEARQINIFVYDVENGLNGIVDNTITYKIVRKNIVTAEEKIIAEVTKGDSNITIKNNIVSITVTDNTTLNATSYLYRCDKVKDVYSLLDYTPTVSIQTLPQRIENFKVNYDNSKYNTLGIPSTLNLNWQSLDTAINNFDVMGYNIYYSLSPRGKGQWSEWNKLHGFSTDPTKSYVVQTLPPTSHEINVDVPQLADSSNPKDVMFSIVAMTRDGRKSMYSDVATVSLYNTITQVIDMYKTSIMTFNFTSENVRPVRLEFEAGAFGKSTTVLFNRSQYDPSLGTSDDSLFTYNIKSDNPLKKWVTLKVDLQLYVGQTHEVRMFNPTTRSWDSIPSTYNGDTNQIEIILTTITSFVIIVKGVDPKTKRIVKPSEVFAKYTNKIIQQLPTWFKIRRDPLNSVGAQFLNVTGLEYDEMEFILNYAYEQSRIDKADLTQVDIVYKAKLPASIVTGDITSVRADNFSLERVINVSDFFNLDSGIIRSEIHYTNPYIVDYEKRYVYVRKAYNPSTDNRYGELYITVYNGTRTSEEPYFKGYVPLEQHHIWNFFDEFGMLLNTPRLPGEINADYKERILDVFKNISNASKEGLYNGIARELGVRINKTWNDVTQDFVITEPMVTMNMIKVNGVLVDTKDLYYTTDNSIVIKNRDNKYINGSTVTYTSGIEMHTFHNRNDIRLYNQLYTIEETATELFKYYVDLIKQKIPTDWGKFRWNEGHWDINDEKGSGLGFLPVIHDGKIKGFQVIDEYGNKSGHIDKTINYIKPIVIFPPHQYIPTGKPIDLGVSIIPGDTKVKDTYWDIIPVNPSRPPIVPGAPQTIDDVKDIIGKNIDNYIPSNNTTPEDLKAGFGYGVTDPNVSIDLGSVGMDPATIDKDGSIHGTVTIHKTGEPDVILPFIKPISKGSVEGSNLESGADHQLYADKPGTYKYTQYVVYENPDGTTGIISDSYVYNIQDDTIDSPTYQALPKVPAQQDVINISYPANAVHQQYKIGETGEWLDYPAGGIIVTANGNIYSRCDNVFGTWSQPSVINITNIDRTPPTATVVVSTTVPTYGTVRVFCYPDEPDSIIINNGGLSYYDFTSNGEFTFDIKDPAGNITHKTVKIDNIVQKPNVIIDYSTLEIVDDDVLATVISDLPITITNNGGSFTYDFIENGKFTFEYVDKYNIPGSITAVVNNISHVPPHVTIVYSETQLTDSNVIARLVSDKPITITNNNGSDEYTFTSNGEFTFLYKDEWGYNYSATAVVNNIIHELHIVGNDVYTYTDDTSMELHLDDPIFTNVSSTGSGTVVNVYQGGVLIGTSPIGGGSYIIPINPTVATFPITFEVVGGPIGMGYGPSISIPYTVHDGLNSLPGSISVPYNDSDGTGATTDPYVFNNRFPTSGGTPTLPTLYISYSELAPTTNPVIATVISNRPLVITNNGGSWKHTFNNNGEFTFEYRDAYGNPGTITAKVKNIYHVCYVKESPGITDIYTFSKDVKFKLVIGNNTVLHVSDGHTLRANDSIFPYNTSDSYQITVDTSQSEVDISVFGEETLAGTVAAYVSFDWYLYDNTNTLHKWVNDLPHDTTHIFKIHNSPVGFPIIDVTYDKDITKNITTPITATLISDRPITIKNNNGSSKYTFTKNGSFTWEIEDSDGNAYTKTAIVKNIIDIIVTFDYKTFSGTGVVTLKTPSSNASKLKVHDEKGNELVLTATASTWPNELYFNISGMQNKVIKVISIDNIGTDDITMKFNIVDWATKFAILSDQNITISAGSKYIMQLQSNDTLTN